MSLALTTPVVHDPQEILDYSMDWSDVLVSGETISTSLWTAVADTEGTLSLSNAYNGAGASTSAGTNTTSVATVWIVSATAGDAKLKNHITTSAGREYERTALVTVRHR